MISAFASRILLCIAPTIPLAGCGSSDFGGSYWTDYLKVARQSISASFTPQKVTREQAASVPFASLGYAVNGGSQQMLVLATSSNGDQIWTAASRVVLAMHDGRVLRSVNLPHDLAATTPTGTAEPLPLATALKGSFISTRLVDLPDIGIYQLELSCQTTMRGSQAVDIIGTRMDLKLVQERCESRKHTWSFVNDYWLDPQSGFIWRSVQHVHPRTTLTIEILRPTE